MDAAVVAKPSEMINLSQSNKQGVMEPPPLPPGPPKHTDEDVSGGAALLSNATRASVHLEEHLVAFRRVGIFRGE